MYFHGADNLKLEEASETERFSWFGKIMKLLKMLEVALALAFLLLLSTHLPPTVDISVRYFMEHSICLLKPHVVFLVENAIIITLVLSHKDNAGIENADVTVNDYFTRDYEIPPSTNSSSDHVLVPQSPPPLTEELADDIENCKQIVSSENGVAQRQCDAVVKAIDKATKQIERFQRTQSNKLKREIAARPKREEGWSETGVGWIAVNSSERRGVTSYEGVENLSNEQFRLMIEAFIEKHQNFFHAQKLVEEKSLNTNSRKRYCSGQEH